jgi:outer membrane protein assembly factor BamD (BamD/ComL family)
MLDRDPAGAYRLTQQSEREFPHGLLSEERQALAIVALAHTGASAAAEQKAREFFRSFPQSPLRERIQAALKR